MLLNLLGALIVVSFIMIPQVSFEKAGRQMIANTNCSDSVIVYDETRNVSQKYFRDNVTEGIKNTHSDCCHKEYELIIDKTKSAVGSTLSDQVTNFMSTFFTGKQIFHTGSVKIVNKQLILFLGTGWMEDSVLFYGNYIGTFVFVFDSRHYDFPTAYFLVIFTVFLLNLIYVVYTSAKSAKERAVENIEMEGRKSGMASLVFGGWDHKIR